MPDFQYRAVKSTGGVESGHITARDVAAAKKQLQLDGKTPLSVANSTVSTAASKAERGVDSSTIPEEQLEKLLARLGDTAGKKRRKKRTDQEDILRFTSELSILLKSGLPLDRSLKIQIDTSVDGPFKTILMELLDSLKAGQSLSSVLSQRQDIFGDFYINIVRSGEASGQLANVLAELAAYLEKTKAIRSAVISALIYPTILAVVAALSIFIMLGYVVPEFQSLFEDMGDSLPLLTAVIVSMGNWVGEHTLFLVAITTATVFVIRRWLRSPNGRQWLHLRSLTLPIVGPVVTKYEVARFTRTMGTLLGNGVKILPATNIAVGTVSNSIVQGSLAEVAPVIKRGGRLSSALDSRIFSPVAMQMVKVGEESGTLAPMLLELAEVIEADVEAEIKRGLTLLEPLLILGMGGVIAFIIMGILMGILSVNTLVV